MRCAVFNYMAKFKFVVINIILILFSRIRERVGFAGYDTNSPEIKANGPGDSIKNAPNNPAVHVRWRPRTFL